MEELKKCPFCGGKTILTPCAHDHNIYQIGCMDKSCIAHYFYLPMGKEKAITKWNNRAATAEVDIDIHNKSISEFAKKLKQICNDKPIEIDRKLGIPLYMHKDGKWHSLIDDVAERLMEDKE